MNEAIAALKVMLTLTNTWLCECSHDPLLWVFQLMFLILNTSDIYHATHANDIYTHIYINILKYAVEWIKCSNDFFVFLFNVDVLSTLIHSRDVFTIIQKLMKWLVTLIYICQIGRCPPTTIHCNTWTICIIEETLRFTIDFVGRNY